MNRITRHRREVVLPGERRPVPRWRFAAVFVLAGPVYFGVSAMSGDENALTHTLIWLAIASVCAGLLWLWKGLPTRVPERPPRYTRDELIRATCEALLVFGVAFLPYSIRDGPTAKTWIAGPILLLGMIGAWLLWVLPAEKRRNALPSEFTDQPRRPKAKTR